MIHSFINKKSPLHLGTGDFYLLVTFLGYFLFDPKIIEA